MVRYRKIKILCTMLVIITALICILILLTTWIQRKQAIAEAQKEEALRQEQAEQEESLPETVETEIVEEIGELPSDAEDIPADTDENASEEVTFVPEEPANVSECIVEKDPELYAYEDFCNDLQYMQAQYPELFQYRSLGKTFDNRDLWLCVIGNEQASKKIFIDAGIHAREYITCQLVAKQMDAFLKHLKNQDTYQGISYQDLCTDTAIYVIPMVNPDGMAISQYGLEGIQTDTALNRIYEIASYDGTSITSDYLRRWKANANGVDLNRNFDALWENYAGAGHPSSDHYKGTAIGCEAESGALISLTEQQQFDYTISYHTQGNVIYWYFAQEGTLYDETKKFADRISHLTGYALDANYQNLDPAGYKDWAIYRLKIPSLTIEVGSETSPVPAYQFQGIWERNQYVWEETLLNMR